MESNKRYLDRLPKKVNLTKIEKVNKFKKMHLSQLDDLKYSVEDLQAALEFAGDMCQKAYDFMTEADMEVERAEGLADDIRTEVEKIEEDVRELGLTLDDVDLPVNADDVEITVNDLSEAIQNALTETQNAYAMGEDAANRYK